MKSRTRILLLVLVAAVAIAGCTSFKFSGAQVMTQLPAYTSVGTFDTTIWVHKFLGGSGGITLFDITADAMDAPIYDAIQREIHKYAGDAAVNVTITYGANFIEILLNGITSGIYAPSEARVTGTIVKFNK